MTETVEVGRHEVSTPDEFFKMPEEYRSLASHLMLVHAEGELTGADDYTQVFYKMAPNAYEKLICCERAAEEIQHFELTAKVLSDILMGNKVAEHLNISTEKYRKLVISTINQ